MSIDKKIDDLIEALDRNTAALSKAGGQTASAPAETTTATRTKKAAAKDEVAKITQEMVNSALIKIKDDFGMPEAKAVIQEHGKCEKMAEIKPAQYTAVYEAAVVRHAELSDGGEDDSM